MHPTQSGKRMSQGLDGVRKTAKERKQERFTALLHHLNVDLLRDSFYALQRKASPGVDGVTWQEYETGLEDRLVDLHSRVHRGAYRAKPSRRVFIPLYRRLTGGNVRWASRRWKTKSWHGEDNEAPAPKGPDPARPHPNRRATPSTSPNYPARHYETGLIASSLPRCRLTAAAKADFGNRLLIAAVNRCATQK